MKAGVVSSRTAQSLVVQRSLRPNLATLCVMAALVPLVLAAEGEAGSQIPDVEDKTTGEVVADEIKQTTAEKKAEQKKKEMRLQAAKDLDAEYEDDDQKVNSAWKSAKERAAEQAFYPSDFLEEQEIYNGGSALYLLGILYCFMGIKLANENYINPSIDIIKKKGVLSSESMNATLLAMTNSLAESFIIMNSIFFGVSDIGISTVVQQAAFYSLIIQGAFYLIVEENTLVDWWIITRETIFFLLYLIVMSFFLYGNEIKQWKAWVLFILYIVHIILMKYSQKYEVAIKTSLANKMEIRALKGLAANPHTMKLFHMSPRTNAISIEMLNKVRYRLQDNYIVFEDTGIVRPLIPIVSIKLGEEQFAEPDDKALMARLNLKRAVTKIIVKLQAFKFNQQIKRTIDSRIRLPLVTPLMREVEKDDETDIGELFESDGEEPNEEQNVTSSVTASEMKRKEDARHFQLLQGATLNRGPQHLAAPTDAKVAAALVNNVIQSEGSSQAGDKSGRSSRRKSKTSAKQQSSASNAQGSPEMSNSQESDSESFSEQDSDLFADNQMPDDEELEKYGEYIENVRPTDIPQSQVYELIMRTVYTQEPGLRLPNDVFQRVLYIIFFPLTFFQYCTIPNPMRPNKENFYPLTLVMSIFWVWFYCYCIVWWTFVVTQTYDLHFSILPMVIYPFGIAMRDTKKFFDLKLCLDKFSTRLRDQKLSLAETYSGQVYQITGLMGIAWVMYISFKDVESISFINEGVQYQMPILIVVVIIKYLILACRRFKTSKKLFYSNLVGYTLFLIVVILLDYREEIFGVTCPTLNTLSGSKQVLSKTCSQALKKAQQTAKAAGEAAASAAISTVKKAITP